MAFYVLLVKITLTALTMLDFAEISIALFSSWPLFICIPRLGLTTNDLVWLIAQVGTLSYSLYRTHVPVQCLCRIFSISGEPSESILPTLAGVLITLLASIAVYWITEHKSLGFSHDVHQIAITDNA